MVGDVGFEPTTSRTRIVRATTALIPVLVLRICALCYYKATYGANVRTKNKKTAYR